ncbi:MAG: hypothetical protein R3211_00890 [Balneolaceae bacterium]|nr:hypothetical protein [Balneolaceae bacterium]
MNQLKKPSRLLLLLAGILLITAACQNMQSLFDQHAYQQAVNLKVESLKLMDKASEPFADHKSAVESLKTDLQKAYEYAKGRPQNTESIQQWEIMIDPEGSLLGGFLAMWEERGQISTTMVEQSKGNIEEGFDIIMELESGKRK